MESVSNIRLRARTIPVETIFLSSTDYDLHDFRNALTEALNKIGFTTDTFVTAPYDPIPDSHSHDQCLSMVEAADCVVGIVGMRAGSAYAGTKYLDLFSSLEDCPTELTITGAEIVYALELKKPTVILVRRGVWNARNQDKLPAAQKNLLDYLTRRSVGNYLHQDVEHISQAVSIIIVKAGITPRRRLRLIGEAMSGRNWNGERFFTDKEITVQNKQTDSYSALDQLRVVGETSLSEREDRLKWLVQFLSEHQMTPEDVEFLVSYLFQYAGYSPQPQFNRKQADEDNKAIHLMERMRFGDDSVFGGYHHSVGGMSPTSLKWPRDAQKWSPHGRMEFLLYSLCLENGLPLNLRRMIEFSAAFNSATGLGFVAHYSRKPVTVGCANACKVRLRKDGGSRGIHLSEEMKSMLYLSNTGDKYCLIAAHGEGDKIVAEKRVLEAIGITYGISLEDIPVIKSEPLLEYLDSISSPPPMGTIFRGRKLTKDGAQQLIGLYASAINPVSVLKSVEFKYYFLQNFTQQKAFDVLMLWDSELIKRNECYNNAGSPTWGVRFKPRSMFDHVKTNANFLMRRLRTEGFNADFNIDVGTYFEPEGRR